jgi:hypothetical protein
MLTRALSVNGGNTQTFDRLVKAAGAGELEKTELAATLSSDSRPAFLEACAAIERKLRDECAGSGHPCLEDGCAMEGEACLQAVLNAGPEYQKACAAVWIEIFRDPLNRSEHWAG